MAFVDPRMLIAPTEKIHKQYLCILLLHGYHSIRDAVKVLNARFRIVRVYGEYKFDEALTRGQWERMLETEDREVRWARGLRGDDRHIRRVLEHAERILGEDFGDEDFHHGTRKRL